MAIDINDIVKQATEGQDTSSSAGVTVLDGSSAKVKSESGSTDKA